MTTILKDVTNEQECRTRLAGIRERIRDFERKSNPITRTPELWERYMELNLEAAYLEESLEKMVRCRGSKPKNKPQTVMDRARNRRRNDDA